MILENVGNKFNISFASKRKFGQSFENFAELNLGLNIEEKLEEIISDESNYISEGKHNKVYNIPGCEDFVLKFSKRVTPENVRLYKKGIKKRKDIFPEINVGQPICDLGKEILVILRQNGHEHSIHYNNRDKLTQKDVNKYLLDIKKLSLVSQKGYNNFTDEVKELLKKGYYVDYFNSNNLMTTLNEINSVDIVKKRGFKRKMLMFPSKESIMKLFVDENILPNISDALSDKQKEELAGSIKKISKKTSFAFKHSKLPDRKITTNIIDFLMDRFKHGNNKKFKRVLKTYI